MLMRKRTPVLALVLLVSCAACSQSGSSGAAADQATPTEASPKSEQPLRSRQEIAAGLHQGIDVSGHAGSVDWRRVRAAGHSFAYVKATEGDDLKDPLFDSHWSSMKEAGLVRGAYHFYVTEDDPDDQAAFFIESVQLESGDLAPVVDVEVLGHSTSAGIADRLQIFLERLEEHYGVRPMIYTEPNFWNKYLTENFGHYPLWVAEYESDEPRLPKGWTNWYLWQWKGDAEVPGVEKGADLSRLNELMPDRHLLLVP